MNFTKYDIECIEKTKLLIDADITTHTSIASLAAQAGIGTTKLKAGFKKLYNIGLFTYLRKQRMIRARMLLLNTDKTIKQIAKLTGYSYSFNFTAAFTSFYGIAPGRYRKKMPPNNLPPGV